MLKAFIASAFGYKDVDAIYDDAVVPVLQQNSFGALRVDRVEYNGDIDDRILMLIREADFCIADLTYARPSVYYEAGLVQGLGKPVIYTARSDHFRARDNDKQGNLRVHFDLLMRNIIPWASPSETFKNRLGARIRHVTKDLVREEREKQKLLEHQKRFRALNLPEKYRRLTDKAKAMLRSRGFSITNDLGNSANLPNTFLAFRSEPSAIWVRVVCFDSFLKRDIQRLAQNDLMYGIEIFPANQNPGNIFEDDLHLIAASLRSVPVSRLEDGLPLYSWQGDVPYSCYSRETRAGAKRFIHLISPVSCEEEFIAQAQNVLGEIV